MVQLGERKRFFAKALSGTLIRQHPRWKHLDSHVTLELFIAGAVDHAHTTRADLLKNAIVGKSQADDGVRGGHYAEC